MIRRRHTKKNWDGHFYIQACSYIQTCLTHKCAFTQRLYHTHTLSHTDVIHKHFYTHTERCFYKQFRTQSLLQPMLLHTDWHFCTHYAFTRKRFYAHILLRTAQALLHKRFYTETLLHTHTHTPFTHKHVYLAMLPKECHFEPLFDLVMLLQPFKKKTSRILHAEKQSAFFFATGQCYWKMLLTKPT